MRTSRALPPILALLAVASIARADGPKVDFDRDVRPILADKCFACHGPDEAARESGLRLDVRAEALAPAESGKPAIVPGDAPNSPLLKRIRATRDSVRMPPPKSNKTLTPAQVETLAAWIAQGAEYAEHWAFRPPARPVPPRGDWGRNPIDAFLLAKMTEKGLAPSPEADRPTLIRRLTLDLTGLPPTPAEVDRFLADTSSDAYERLVDRLMASPRYGERMAVDWLDAARFADTHGYHIDSGRDMSRWRAWVIDSYNRNTPFDRFTVEQVAGDLLPDASLEQKIASGFNRNHMINFEGGAVPEEYHAAYIIDRVNTTGTVWMGLTVGCAQCHDHKFDPIKQRDYYGLYAFFHNVPENGLDGSKGNAAPVIPAPSAEQQAELDALASRVEEARARLNRPDPEADAAQGLWEARSVEAPRWAPPRVTAASAEGATLKAGDDGVIVADGANPATDVYRVRIARGDAPITAVRVEMLPDERYPNKGPGRSVNGNVVMTKVRIEPGDGGGPLAVRSAWADFSQATFPVAATLDDDDRTGWALDPEEGKPHHAAYALAAPFEGPELALTLEFRSPFASHQPGRFRVTTTSAPDPEGAEALPKPVRDALAVASAERSEAQKAAIRGYFRREHAAPYREIVAEIDALLKRKAEVEKGVPTAMVMAEMAKPRDTFLLMRGQYDQKGEKVAASVPGFLPPLPADAPANRLGLARWLVSPENPLTARVAINRLWQTVFGTGLVKTSEDFGTQGEAPSHPELLDWLAVEFAAPTEGTPWDVKRMVRLMVTSAAYRQSSRATEDALEIDPENRLLARAPRLRLQAEFLRDQALFLGGLLKEKVGGPSVSPYNPPGLWEELMSRSDGANWSAQTYVQSHGDDLYRRTMYTFWKRTCPPPSLATFDAPDRETCTVRRARTNTPLQALVMLNDPTYVEAARKLAERILKEGGPGPEDRIAFAFRLATARPARPEEVAILLDVYRHERAKFAADPEAAMDLLKTGEAPRDESLDPAEVAAWTTVSGVILNLDEVVTKG